MGMLWTDNDARNRLKRLVTKLTGTPFLPLLAISKLVESVIAGGPLVVWSVATVVSILLFVVAEDLLEYAENRGETLLELFDH